MKRRHGSTIIPSFLCYLVLDLWLFPVRAHNLVVPPLDFCPDTNCDSIADSVDFTLPGTGESSQNWSFYHPIAHKRVRHYWRSVGERPRSHIESFSYSAHPFLSANQKLKFLLAFPLALNFIASGECVYAHR